jgi:hypothetical protein
MDRITKERSPISNVPNDSASYEQRRCIARVLWARYNSTMNYASTDQRLVFHRTDDAHRSLPDQ